MADLSRAQFLRAGVGGGVALVAGGGVLGLARPARASREQEPSEGDLATVRLAASAELLAQAFYTGALRSKLFASDERAYLERARANEADHYAALAKVLGDSAPVADDFEFAFPNDAFARRGRLLRLGSVLETVFVGSYAAAAGSLADPGLQVVAAQLAASEAQHLSVLAGLRGGSPVGASFPQTFDLEQASAVLDPFLGD